MSTLNPHVDWVGLIEAIHDEHESDAAWMEGIAAKARPLFPRAIHLMAYSLAYDAGGNYVGVRPGAAGDGALYALLERSASTDALRPFHFGPPVLTMDEGIRELRRDQHRVHAMIEERNAAGYRDALGVVAHPRPGVVTTIVPLFEHKVELTRRERELLTRVSLHLESGHRLRLDRGAVITELHANGRTETPTLDAHVARIEEARSTKKRRTPEGLELWTALLDGRMSVIPRRDRYLVLDNPMSSHRMRALTQREIAVLSLASRGSSSKQICYALGISPPLVSTALQSAAAKIGVLTRLELIRLAALFTRDPKGLLDDDNLTAAEHEILALLERGLRNEQIAAIRTRSVRTIANQVASLLRKTGHRLTPPAHRACRRETRVTTLSSGADYARVLEAIHADEASDASWAAGLLDAARPLFPRAAIVGTYAFEHDASFEVRATRFAAPQPIASLFETARGLAAGHASATWLPFHFGRTVVTQQEALRAVDASVAREVQAVNHDYAVSDGVGIIAHPRPGLVTALWAIFDKTVTLTRTERQTLTRIALHLDAGHRLRTNAAAIIAEVDARGRIETPTLGAHVARIDEARSKERRSTPEATALWTALLEGRVSVVPRGPRYVVLDNPTDSHRIRALTARETAILSLAARGSSSKQICYALGLSPSIVSTALQSATAKVGVLSRIELVRLAALLTRDPKGLLEDDALTSAEAEVLALLERGLGNAQIATIRMRSVRTIANQVASLLRKTGAASRRQLVARVKK